jgi:hypothetical protein
MSDLELQMYGGIYERNIDCILRRKAYYYMADSVLEFLSLFLSNTLLSRSLHGWVF